MKKILHRGMTATASGICFVVLLSGGGVFAQAPEPAVAAHNDGALPQPIGSRHFEALTGNSPFLRPLNLTETYVLRGIARIDGEPVATLFNRETKKSVLVTTNKANAERMQLVAVNEADAILGITAITATITFDGEKVELKFEPERVAPAPKSSEQHGGPGQGAHGEKGGDHGKRRGPSKEERARYEGLSEEKKAKFRTFMGQTMRKYPNLSREERGNMIRGALIRLSDGGDISVDKDAGGSSSSGKR